MKKKFNTNHPMNADAFTVAQNKNNTINQKYQPQAPFNLSIPTMPCYMNPLFLATY